MLKKSELKNLSPEELKIKLKTAMKDILADVKKKEKKQLSAQKKAERKAENNLKYIIGGIVLASVKNKENISLIDVVAQAQKSIEDQKLKRKIKQPEKPKCSCGAALKRVISNDKSKRGWICEIRQTLPEAERKQHVLKWDS